MPTAHVNGVEIYYEETGDGYPVVWSHEFGGDYRSWEPQVRHFARSHRCIAYAARGYRPSDVPGDPTAYSYRHFAADVSAMLRFWTARDADWCFLAELTTRLDGLSSRRATLAARCRIF